MKENPSRVGAPLFVSAIILLLGSVIAAGCANNAPRETNNKTEDKKPELSFVQPQQDESLAGPDVTAEVEIKNFKIVNRIGEQSKKGEGHIHWIVDNGEQIPSTSDTFVATGLTSGEHTIAAQLHQNDHSPLDPPVTAEVVFAITEPEPGIGGATTSTTEDDRGRNRGGGSTSTTSGGSGDTR